MLVFTPCVLATNPYYSTLPGGAGGGNYNVQDGAPNMMAYTDAGTVPVTDVVNVAGAMPEVGNTTANAMNGNP